MEKGKFSMHTFRFDTKFKPEEEAFHLGIQRTIKVTAINIYYSGDEFSISYGLVDKEGRSLRADESMLVPVEHANYYLKNVKPFNPFDKGRY